MKRSAKGLIPTSIVALALLASGLAPARLSSITLTSVCTSGPGGAPNVTGISKTFGPTAGGIVVNITGCAFTGLISVHFGTALASWALISDTSINANSPAHAAATVDITVTTALGTSATSAADQFTYTDACKTANIVPDKASPQPVGTVITFTGSSTNCPNPRYEFWMLRPGSHTWEVVQPYSASNTLVWDTASIAAGTYQFIVMARDASSSGVFNNGAGTTYDASASLSYTLTAVPTPCTAVNASALPASPQLAGTPVTVTAIAVTCPNPRYQFWILLAGSQTWLVAKFYSVSNTYNWDTTSITAGVYKFMVMARDASSAGTSNNGGGTTFDAASAILSFTITNGPPCTSVGAVAAPPSPQPQGTTVTITATPTGCPNPRYEFWKLAPGSQMWQKVQGYSTTNTLTWDTTGSAAGTYKFIVMIKDKASAGISGSGSADSYDAFAMISYTLSSTACTSVAPSSSPSGTAAAGTPVTITGNAVGCPNPRYDFWMLAPGSQTWQNVQIYSASASFNWVTTGAAKGTYKFIIMARDNASPGVSNNGAGTTFDAYATLSYTLT